MALNATTHFLNDKLPVFAEPFQRNIYTANTTWAINGTRTLAVTVPSIRMGQWRFKVNSYPGAGAGQLTSLKVTASDGTNTIVLAYWIGGFDASDLLDLTGQFFTDQPLTTISFIGAVANVANGQLNIDVNIAGTP